MSDYSARDVPRALLSDSHIFFPARRFIYIRDLLLTLVGREMKLRYKRSILGIAWSLLTPLAQLAVYFLTFDVLLPLNVPNYASFLFTGVLVWNWFQGALHQVTSSVVENRDLIRRPGFPIMVIPIVTVTSHLIHFVLALPILFVFLVWGGIGLSTALLALPLVISLQFLFILSLGYFVAALYVTFRDTQHLLNVTLNLLFFLTPVFYKAKDLPAQYQAYYRLNPMVEVIEAYRTILLSGAFPHATDLARLAILSVSLLVLGYVFFRKVSNQFVDQT